MIHSIPFSEHSVVLKCYTDVWGLQSFLVNGVHSKKGAIRPSQLQPLSLLEVEAYHRQEKNLQRLKELKCQPVLQHLHFDVMKSAVGIFISEVIHKSIKEENHPETELFSFLYHSVQILDLQHESVTNFPVYFLVQFSKYLGFYPKGKFDAINTNFDIGEATFVPEGATNRTLLPARLSRILTELLESSYSDYHKIQMLGNERSILMEWLIKFYMIHISNFPELKSHHVLRSVFE